LLSRSEDAASISLAKPLVGGINCQRHIVAELLPAASRRASASLLRGGSGNSLERSPHSQPRVGCRGTEYR
jgi:hypothetical protein